MKKLLFALAACVSFSGAALAFDDDYDDEDVRVYVTPRYRTVEPIVVRREVFDEPIIYREEPAYYTEDVRFVTPQEVRTRHFLRRTHQTAPNHR